MKIEASAFVKQVWAVVSSVLKSKSNAIKGKADAVKTKVIVLGVLKNKKVFGTISQRMNSLFGHDHDGGDRSAHSEMQNAITVYRRDHQSSQPHFEQQRDDDRRDADFLSHTLFDLEPADYCCNSNHYDNNSARNSSATAMDQGRASTCSDLSPEDEIDILADAFIKRFHGQMRLQKLHSYKRYQEMLDRSV